jgi:signal transduction histidine kinase/ligand-binding sensor domain-containing protein/CheY-like chemotaxis protein
VRLPSPASFLGIIAVSLAAIAATATAQDEPTVVPAHTEQYNIELLGADVNIPQTSVVLTGHQTRDGYIWLGTEGGLARFDGVQFVVFRASNTPAFRSNLVQCLLEDRTGNLWIGTERGLVRLRNRKFELIAAIPDVPIMALAEDANGTIWVGTHGSGLYAVNGTAAQCYLNDPAMISPSVSALFFDSTDRLWVGFETEGLVFRHDGVFTRWDESRRKIEGSVLSIAEDPHGTLWFGTSMHRLFRLSGNRMVRFRSNEGLPGVQIVGLSAAQGGGLWVVGGGVTKVIDPERFTLSAVPHLPTSLINAAFEDREGTLWICSRDMGLIRARKVPYRTIGVAEGLPASGVKAVSEDPQGNIWLAVLRKGVVRVSPTGEVRTFASADGISTADPWSVLADSDGQVWVGARGPLSVGRDGKWRQITQVRNALGLFEDRHGDVWIGTETDGVFRSHHGQITAVDLGPGPAVTRVGSFCDTHDGAVYIGTMTAGLLKLQNGKVTRFDHQTGLPADDVRAVFEDSEQRLWVGFRSRGLALFDQGRWLNPHPLSEAAADHVTAITEDTVGQLWLGTPAGVMWGPKSALVAAAEGTGPAPTMQRASSADVLHIATVWSGPQPIVWKANDGKLLFATRRGLLTINPGRLPRNPVPPPVHIERVTLDRAAVDLTSTIKAPAGTRDIAIDYTALSFVQPKLVRFKYRLAGYDREWIDAGARRTAYYTHLPPGDYRFQVQACNDDGVWNTDGDSIQLVQQPHFYQLWWFYFCLALAGGGVALGIYRWRTAVLRRENEKLNRLVAERTRELELSNTAKTEFLETVSHEIRNPLNGLKGLLTQLKSFRPGAAERELMDAILACTRSLTRVFEDVLAHARLEHGHLDLHENAFRIGALLDDVARSFAWPAAQSRSPIHVQLPPDFADGFIGDENKIKTIIENFVGNAVKYAPGAPIELRAEAYAGEGPLRDVHLEVCDHGPGIPSDEQRLIFRKFVRGTDAKQNRVPGTGLGLATCEVLARTLGGQVGVESEVGHGAVFFLRVPLRPGAPAHDGVVSAGTGSALIVEDEHYNQVVLRGIAIELGYDAKVASNAQQAEALLAAGQFNVVFLDWELPGLKGGDIARHIRAQPANQQAIIIAMTAHDSAEIRRQCREAGMDEFLRKPYDLAQVRQRIAHVMAKRRGTRPAEGNGDAPAFDRLGPETTPTDGTGPDWTAFSHYAAGSADGAVDPRMQFIEALRAELAAIERTDPDDHEGLARGAHRMYAVAAVVKAEPLMTLAKTLECLPQYTSAAERRDCVERLRSAAVALQAQAAALAATANAQRDSVP